MAWPVRYKIVGLLFCGSVINYIDRVNISVAAPVMMKELGWEKDSFGLVFSAFLIGYTLLQIPGGIAADRWSGRKMLALAFCGFSLFTLLTPLGQSAFMLMLVLRFLVGAFESATIPALTSFNARWIPRPEFGLAQTVSISGIAIGQIIAYPLTTWILLQGSWSAVFSVNAAFGFLWVVLWMWYVTDNPLEHPAMGREERNYIAANLRPRPAATLPFRSLLTFGPLLILCISYMCHAYISWMFMFWFPTYLVEARGFSLVAMGGIGMLVHGAGFLAIVGGGVVSDWLLRRGWSPRVARTCFAGLCTALSVPFLVSAAFVPSAVLCVVLLILFYLVFMSAVVGYTAAPVEINPHRAGAIFGMMNCMASFAGIFGPLTTGFLVAQAENWSVPFLVAAVCGVISATTLFFVSLRPIAIHDHFLPLRSLAES